MRSENREMGREYLFSLTDEEIAVLAQEGDQEAYEFLIDKYKELAKQKSKLYHIAGGDRDDVIQEGIIGLFKAIRDYDSDKEASFRTFADLCVNRQIINAIQKANRKKHLILTESVSLNSQEEGNDGELQDIISSEADTDPQEFMALKEIAVALVSEDSSLLSPMEKKIFVEMLKGKDYREIATTLNKSAKTVDNAIQRIKRKMRRLTEE